MHYLAEYILFFAKTLTLLAAFLFIMLTIASMRHKQQQKAHDGEIDVEKLNDTYDEMSASLQHAVLDKDAYKQFEKEKKQQKKQKGAQKKRLFVLTFDGDIKATEVELLREEITAILQVATSDDEVLLLLESAGGLVHSYGLAASQLARIRSKNIPLTVAIDRVAASGGYMMACVANQILAAPFAVVGSVGVVAQMPNFHRLLKKNDIEFEQITAGQYKRTLTLFGENTSTARAKFQQDLDETHVLFKEFIQEYRPSCDIETIATGEHWYGRQAVTLNLVDTLMTSDDYLLAAHKTHDIYQVNYTVKESVSDKIQHLVEHTLAKVGVSTLLKATQNAAAPTKATYY